MPSRGYSAKDQFCIELVSSLGISWSGLGQIDDIVTLVFGGLTALIEVLLLSGVVVEEVVDVATAVFTVDKGDGEGC